MHSEAVYSFLFLWNVDVVVILGACGCDLPGESIGWGTVLLIWRELTLLSYHFQYRATALVIYLGDCLPFCRTRALLSSNSSALSGPWFYIITLTYLKVICMVIRTISTSDTDRLDLKSIPRERPHCICSVHSRRHQMHSRQSTFLLLTIVF